jgi:peroxiredoxin
LQTGSARRITYVIGPDRRIMRAYEKVVPKAHPDEVLRDLTAGAVK